MADKEAPRKGCQDVWNAFMVDGAQWSENDIPICPTTATSPPRALISYSEAKTLCNKAKAIGDDNLHIDAFVHFYQDDQKFVGERTGIWDHADEALEIISHFAGMITPDFSTYADFPDPIKRDATYKMRAFGYYAGKKGHAVINNNRWGTVETWSYCNDGIQEGSMVAIGTVASDIHALDNRPLFEGGLMHMADVLHPRVIIVYGSARNHCFDILRARGVEVIVFPSDTDTAFREARSHEQRS